MLEFNFGWAAAWAFLYGYGSRAIIGLLILFIGWKVINYITKLLVNTLAKTELEDTVETFLCSLVKMALRAILFVIVIGYFGVETTSIVAVLGAASFAVGLALQGSLSNFAGGVLILIQKPFVVGNYITGAGHSGTVTKITIFYTYLVTPDNKQIMVPNSDLSNGSITNFSAHDIRRVDLEFGVGYDSCNEKVKEVIMSVIDKHELILDDQPKFVRMSSHGDSALNYTVRVWSKASDYWDVHFDLIEQVKEAFDKEEISIPYPHIQIVK